MFRWIRAAALAGALVLALAACGGGAAAEETTPTLPTLTEAATAASDATTTTEAVDPEEAIQEYTACMREHGIEMPDPESGDGGGVISIEGDPGDFDLTAFDEAAAACDPILEAAFGEFEMSPEQEAEMMDQQLAFAQCMRDEGIDWPDPDSSGGMMIEIPDNVDPDQLDEAMQMCSQGAFGAEGGIMVGSSDSSSTP